MTSSPFSTAIRSRSCASLSCIYTAALFRIRLHSPAVAGSLSIQAVATPCHTTGHTSFLIRPLLQQRHTHRDDDSSFGTSTGSGNPRLSTETPAEAATSRREKDRAGEGGEELEGQEEEGAGGEGKGGQPILFTGQSVSQSASPT
eukprot:GHVU01210072.1.p1 GENE.GHVU01210072.1~~GHVU01210072.1.p1  ORF type:complete len:145 (-),score=20.79 GHVU01210072.1:35-469(-)